MTSRYRKKAQETAQALIRDTVVPLNQRFGKKIGRGVQFNTSFTRGSEIPSHFTGRLDMRANKVQPNKKLNDDDAEQRSRSLMTEIPNKTKLPKTADATLDHEVK